MLVVSESDIVSERNNANIIWANRKLRAPSPRGLSIIIHTIWSNHANVVCFDSTEYGNFRGYQSARELVTLAVTRGLGRYTSPICGASHIGQCHHPLTLTKTWTKCGLSSPSKVHSTSSSFAYMH
jgi:hypothetical protein